MLSFNRESFSASDFEFHTEAHYTQCLVQGLGVSGYSLLVVMLPCVIGVRFFLPLLSLQRSRTAITNWTSAFMMRGLWLPCLSSWQSSNPVRANSSMNFDGMPADRFIVEQERSDMVTFCVHS